MEIPVIVLQKYFFALGDEGSMFNAMMAEVLENHLSDQTDIKEKETK